MCALYLFHICNIEISSKTTHNFFAKFLSEFLWQKSGNGCYFRRKGKDYRSLHPVKHFRHGRLVRRHCFNQIGILLNFIGTQIVQTLRPVLRLRDPVQRQLSERHLARIRTDKPSPLRIVSQATTLYKISCGSRL